MKQNADRAAPGQAGLRERRTLPLLLSEQTANTCRATVEQTRTSTNTWNKLKTCTSKKGVTEQLESLSLDLWEDFLRAEGSAPDQKSAVALI